MIARAVGGKKNNGKKEKKKEIVLTEEDLADFKFEWNLDESSYSGLLRQYILFGQKCYHIVNGDRFAVFIITIIVIAGINVGMQTYVQRSTSPYTPFWSDGREGLDQLDLGILVIFIIEIVLKLFAEGIAPWKFWVGKEWKWNNFDFWVVFFSFPGWEVILSKVIGGGAGVINLLRLLRLMRVMKIVKKIPQLQMILMGLVGGLKSIVYIMILLFIFIYIFAIMGIIFLGENDPWHFGGLLPAIITLWRMATMEDWTDVMYISLYGCDEYRHHGIYENYDSEDPLSRIELEGLLAVCGRIPECVESMGGDPESKACLDMKNDIAMPNLDSKFSLWFGIFYFNFYIIVCGLVLLSLFVAAITMSMTESVQEMKKLQDEQDRKRRMLKNMRNAEEAARLATVDPTVEGGDGGPDAGAGEAGGADKSGNPAKEGAAPAKMSTTEIRARNRLTAVLMQAWEDVDLMQILEEQEIESLKGREWALWYHKLSLKCTKITESNFFNNFITAVILLAALMVGLNTEIPSPELLETLLFFEVMDLIILFIFIVEVVLKLIACGFEPKQYFVGREWRWNNFDFSIVFASVVFLILYPPSFELSTGEDSEGGAGGVVMVLRLVRLLRVLKLLKAYPQLQVIISALMQGIVSIAYIFVILVLDLYVFAIVGMILFQQNDPWHFGSLHFSLLTLWRCATFEDWTDVMYIQIEGCDRFDYMGDKMLRKCFNREQWFDRNLTQTQYDELRAIPADEFNIDGVVNLDWTGNDGAPLIKHWYNILEDNQCSREQALEQFGDKYWYEAWSCVMPNPQGNVVAFIYFFIFTVITALVLLTLFIAVVTTEMEEADHRRQEEKEIEDKVKVIAQSEGLDQTTVALYKQVFEMLDLDGGGTIEEEELRIGLQSVGKNPTSEEMQRMMDQVDEDGSGAIDFAEFVEFMCNLKKYNDVSAGEKESSPETKAR